MHFKILNFVSIEELKIMDFREQDRILWDLNRRSARELKSFAQNDFGATFQSRLMPLEFGYRFYDWSPQAFILQTALFRAIIFSKINDRQWRLYWRHFLKQILKRNKFTVAQGHTI